MLPAALYIIPMSAVPLKYLTTLCAALSCSSVGAAKKRESSFTASVMSGRQLTVRNNREPTSAWYSAWRAGNKIGSPGLAGNKFLPGVAGVGAGLQDSIPFWSSNFRIASSEVI